MQEKQISGMESAEVIDCYRFIPCGHISISRTIEDHGNLVVACGLCYDVRMTEYLEYIIKRDQMTIDIDDIHPYFGIDTILRFHCMKRLGHSGCKNRGRCNNYFYSTLRDLRKFSSSNPKSAFMLCASGHVTDDVPLYKHITALEVMTGYRFDYPIPIEEGVRIGYNPQLNVAIVCEKTKEENERSIKLLNDVFASREKSAPIKIVSIDPDDDIWTCDFTRKNSDSDQYMVAGLRASAEYILRSTNLMMLCRPIDVLAKVRSTRLLDSTDELAEGEPVVPKHVINGTQFKLGTSGPEILEEDEQRISLVQNNWFALLNN